MDLLPSKGALNKNRAFFKRADQNPPTQSARNPPTEPTHGKKNAAPLRSACLENPLLAIELYEDSLVNDQSFGAPSLMELEEIIVNMRKAKRVSRNDLGKLYSNICQKQQTPTSFSRICTQFGAEIKNMRIDGLTLKGHLFKV